MKNLIIITIAILLSIFACSNSEPYIPGKDGVASAHPLATKAGQEVLAKGGNAFDAAIAVAAVLNVVEPMMSGIGGYGTILVYDANESKVRFLNPSGRFPAKANSDFMRPPTPNFMENRTGPKAISTPGNLNAWEAMHSLYGKLDWKILFDEAINLAENGFKVSGKLAGTIKNYFELFSPYSQSFYGSEGQPLSAGDTLVQKDLARTFRLIAEKGASPFYQGELAQVIDEQMKSVGSFLTIEDLNSNEAEWWEPLSFDYKGYQVYTASLPANSFPAFVNIGLMQQYEDEELEHNTPEYLHLFAEMTKESYKARLAYSFDPDIQEAPLDSLLSPEVLKLMAEDIDRDKASVFVPPFPVKESKNTTHFVVVDQWGNIVSATQTLGGAFGSRVMIEDYGIWMNGSMMFSTFEPKGNPMDVFPGRHKLSGDCPVIITKDGKPWAALGSPGGHTITQNVPQIILNLIDFEMTMQEAIDAPKICFVEPNYILVDKSLPGDIIDSLSDKGHQVIRGTIGNATGIKVLYNNADEIDSVDIGIDSRGEGKGKH